VTKRIKMCKKKQLKQTARTACPVCEGSPNGTGKNMEECICGMDGCKVCSERLSE